MTQTQKIMQHMQKWGSITALEAVNCYGILRLSARIDDLKHMGHRITATREAGENRYGELVHYARYRLEA